jgi:hypothetical protein
VQQWLRYSHHMFVQCSALALGAGGAEGRGMSCTGQMKKSAQGERTRTGLTERIACMA